MKYISEERLKNLLATTGSGGLVYTSDLIKECTELNPWRPIDENTPKDRKVLFYFPTYGIYEDFYENVGTLKMVTQLPTHWAELPEPPKT